MGLFFRKSIRVGLLRFNLSKSGVGVSAGIKGIRVGFGPRGNYVHAGVGGVHYRSTLTPKQTKSRIGSPETALPPAEAGDVLHDIDSDLNLLLRESSGDDLIREINESIDRWYLWKWTMGVFVFLSLFVDLRIMLAGLVLTSLTYMWDLTRKSVVIFYDFDEMGQENFSKAVDAFERFIRVRAIWHIEASGTISDWKKNAGATTSVSRKATTASLNVPFPLKTNIPVPTIHVGSEALCFLPDKVLVISKSKAASVEYRDLVIQISSGRFIEDGVVPSDAVVVGHTWKYVNKKGGPDKRFKDNQQLPICQYEDILFLSATGLNEQIAASKCSEFDSFKMAVQALRRTAA